ncbi:hypothetical protein [Actinophytocola gossypii]|uniref:Metalloprotease n=1 Tax=Actinophytocola gossypii TaxID=2812003 RepID=A0ABT2J6A7_9PSEU|nr:hypothetical protein [Actinophytocola gossypii]MCT2583306.1 hypothetical protein [Actinophytocola gossypii]
MTADPPEEPTGLDDLLHEPPARRAPERAGPRAYRHPAYYVSLTVVVMLVLGMIAGLAVLAADPPVRRVAGTAAGLDIPALPVPTSSTPVEATPPPVPPPDGYAALAAHPLSTSPAELWEVTCLLPTFDADAQEAFYAAAAVCADDAFGGLFAAAELPVPAVDVVTVQDGEVKSRCGAVAATASVTSCAGTVYMTPAYLRDVEGNGRYPGRYLGVFLREYAEVALLAGYGSTYEEAADESGVDDRLSLQATCLVGIASAAMAGHGSVDANITGEIRDRLSAVDALPDANSWLDKGFSSGRLSACDVWTTG